MGFTKVLSKFLITMLTSVIRHVYQLNLLASNKRLENWQALYEKVQLGGINFNFQTSSLKDFENLSRNKYLNMSH